MGKLTQYFDYLSREPEFLTNEFIADAYTHFTLTDEARSLRRSLRLWHEKINLQYSLF